MPISNDDVELACRVVSKMMRKGVIGTHHKQVQTIAGWFASHEQGDVKDVIGELVTDVDAPVRQKGRGTVTLTSWRAAEGFLDRHDFDPPTRW